ncbi:MAG: glycosyltransferase family 4 protein [Alteraurantiacibacter sp.]
MPGDTSGTHAEHREARVIWLNRFFHPDESATSLMLTDLVRDLAGQGGSDRHHLITSNARYAGGHGADGATIAGVTVHRIAAFGRNNKSLAVRLGNFVLFYSGAFFLLLRHARRGDTIVALTDPPLIGTVAALAARLKRARLLHWVQDIFPETATRLGFAREGGTLEAVLVGLRDSAWRRAATCVVIGERMQEFLVDHAVTPDRIAVVPNWADDRAITPVAVDDNALRRDWGYAPEDCVIGYSGNLGRAHEVATKVAAMLRLRDDGPDNARFLFIGGGARQDELRQMAGEWDGDRLAFQPYQPLARLAESLSVPDAHWISLLPQLEGLIVPSKLYGALAAGRAVVFVGDPQGEVARLLAEGECGASFPPGDGDALAAYLARLAHDAPWRQQLGRNARDFVDRELHREGRIAAWRSVLVQQQGRPEAGAA